MERHVLHRVTVRVVLGGCFVLQRNTPHTTINHSTSQRATNRLVLIKAYPILFRTLSVCHTRLNTACPPFFTFLCSFLCKTRSSLLALFHPFQSIFAPFPFPHSPFQSIANRHAAKAFVTLHPFDVPICKQRRWCQLIATSLHNPRYSPQTSSHKHRRLTHTHTHAVSLFIFSLPPTT